MIESTHEMAVDAAALDLIFLDERTCDSPVCLKPARWKISKPCGYEILVCARHRRQFNGWKYVVDNHGHPIPTPAKWRKL